MPKNQESKKEKSKKGFFSFLKFDKSKKKDSSKTILLIGSTGKGKSTLANVISGTSNFKESESSISGTREVQSEKFEEIGYQIIDTVGIGDTKLNKEVVLDKIAEAVYLAKDGISQILFVVDGRFDKYEMANYDLLKVIIFDNKVVNHTTIVRTRFENFKDEEKCKEDVKLMVEESSRLAEIINSCQKRIVHVNNPTLDLAPADNEDEIRRKKREEKIAIRKEERNTSRKLLLGHLNKSCQENYNPDNLKKLNKEIADDYSQYLEKKRELEKEMKKIANDTSSSINIQSIKIQDSVPKVSKKIENKTDSVPRKGKEPIRDNQESKTEDIAIGKIRELEDNKTRLKKEIEEKEKVIRQKVLKHIFNNYEGVTEEMGGNIFLDSFTKDENDWGVISEEFAEKKLKLVLGWKSEGFDYEQVQKWAKALENSFNPQVDVGFCTWLRDTKKLTVEKIKELDYPRNIGTLRSEYHQILGKEVEILSQHSKKLDKKGEKYHLNRENFLQLLQLTFSAEVAQANQVADTAESQASQAQASQASAQVQASQASAEASQAQVRANQAWVEANQAKAQAWAKAAQELTPESWAKAFQTAAEAFQANAQTNQAWVEASQASAQAQASQAKARAREVRIWQVQTRIQTQAWKVRTQTEAKVSQVVAELIQTVTEANQAKAQAWAKAAQELTPESWAKAFQASAEASQASAQAQAEASQASAQVLQAQANQASAEANQASAQAQAEASQAQVRAFQAAAKVLQTQVYQNVAEANQAWAKAAEAWAKAAQELTPESWAKAFQTAAEAFQANAQTNQAWVEASQARARANQASAEASQASAQVLQAQANQASAEASQARVRANQAQAQHLKINLTLEKIAPFFTLEVEQKSEEGSAKISVSLQSKKN